MIDIDEQLKLAVRAHHSGQLPQAWQLYQHILQHDPQHAPTLNASGLLLRQTGRFDDAISFLRRAIEADATDPAFHANLGEAHRGLGNYQEGIDCYHEALRLAPEEFVVNYYLATLYQQAGKLDEAIATFQKAISLRADEAVVHCGLAIALRAAGRLGEAAAAVHEALRLNPDLEAAQQELESIEQESGPGGKT